MMGQIVLNAFQHGVRLNLSQLRVRKVGLPPLSWKGIQDDLTDHDRKSQGQEGGLAPAIPWMLTTFKLASSATALGTDVE
jgi:hypothetical protein